MTTLQLFRNKVVARPSGCWEWTGCKVSDGHGRVSVNKRLVLAHRWSYEAFVGKIDNRNIIHHLCENPGCVNPSHLTQLTVKQHMLVTPRNPARVNKNRTSCTNGHELSGDNLRLYKSKGRPARACKKCNLEAVKRYKLRQPHQLLSDAGGK